MTPAATRIIETTRRYLEQDMMEKDRELLELAAKAAGIHNLMWDDSAEEFMNIEIRPGAICCAWNPLRNDGDALRLAVKLHIRIHPMPGYGDDCVNCATDPIRTDCDAWANEPFGVDPYAATRRAIVRAAAAIATSHPPA